MAVTERDTRNWLVIQTCAGREEKLAGTLGELLAQPDRIFYPRRRLFERRRGTPTPVLKSFYPGYFFVKGSGMPAENVALMGMIGDWRDLLPGFIKMLHHRETQRGRVAANQGRAPTPICCPEHEMAAVFHLVNRSGVVEESGCIRKKGERVEIVSGPLKGKEGIIHSVDGRRRRLRIEMLFFGAPRLVTVSMFEVE